MRVCLLVASVILVAACGYFSTQRETDKTVTFHLQLRDADTKQPLTGLVRLRSRATNKAIALPGLFDRMTGVKAAEGWHVLPREGAKLTLPADAYTLEAFAGLETVQVSRDLDLTKVPPESITVQLPFLFRPEKHNLVAGNTHLHLMKVSKETADAYVRQVPAADQLKVLFLSYLERKPDDKDYITNRYPIGDLKEFDATGVLVNNGEEHRHNFKAYGQGYGHVMFLNIKKLVEPVSIGPGIMGKGFDDPALRPGIEEARKQGGTVIWCHNTNGYEDVLHALAGRLDALNVFDGSRGGDYETNYYRYLNVGMRLPISTGTDWFMYDLSRVYAEVPGKLTIPAWLDAVKKGKCQATNGPLLSLQVDGQGLGDVIAFGKPRKVRIEARGIGRHAFTLELVHNGKVIQSSPASKRAPHVAEISHELFLDAPGWFAARVSATEKNELGHVLFAHTSPIYVNVEGKRVFQVDDALALLKQIEEGSGAVVAQGVFSSDEARRGLVAMYAEAAEALRERINKKR